MLLPDSFVFTQQNLQDYSDCPYRFYLREILKLEWPAIESEPIRDQEALMQLGTRFHLLCQQYFSGIPAEVLSAQITQPELAEWWQNFLILELHPEKGSFSVEKLISIPFAGYRLAAKIDLLLNTADNTVIYDWKTSQHQPKRLTLQERMQSKVYPLVVAQLPLYQNLALDQLEMVYWYPAFPQTPISFSYSRDQYETDETKLKLLIEEIASKNESGFYKTNHEKTCRFCRFRSLCNRGINAGTSDLKDEPIDLDDAFNFDFDAI